MQTGAESDDETWRKLKSDGETWTCVEMRTGEEIGNDGATRNGRANGNDVGAGDCQKGGLHRLLSRNLNKCSGASGRRMAYLSG